MLFFYNIINFICKSILQGLFNYYIYMSIKKYIPNSITLLNLFSGCIALYFASINQIYLAAAFTVLGIFFDFFDGFFARLFNVQSELGLQLDSMADMVTSGMVPGMILFQLLKKSHLVEFYFPISFPSTQPVDYISFLGFIVTAASGYRLAKFNIDSRQTSSFIGLPTPANTLLVISLALICYQQPHSVLASLFTNTYVLLAFVAFSAYILNAEIPLFALKFKSWDFRLNWMRYLLVLMSISFVLIFTYTGVLISILFYILLSFFINIKEHKK